VDEEGLAHPVGIRGGARTQHAELVPGHGGGAAVSVFYLASLSHWNDRDASPAVTEQHKQGERHGRLL
jgi:hypothetical protein